MVMRMKNQKEIINHSWHQVLSLFPIVRDFMGLSANTTSSMALNALISIT